MFKKSHRLTRSAFTTTFQQGKRFHFPTHTIIIAPHDTLAVAVVTSKKVARLAVLRNRLRRRAYAAMCNAVLPPAQYIVLLKPTFAALSRRQQQATISDSLARTIKPSTLTP
jgi:ribonuclease P protein component